MHLKNLTIFVTQKLHKATCGAMPREYFTATSVTTMILQYRQLLKRVFNVSAILFHNTLQTTFPLSDAVTNEAPWQCASLQHDRLLQLINGVKLSSCRGRLAPECPRNGVIHQI